MQSLWAVLASLCFAWMGLSIKMTINQHSVVSLLVWRAWPTVVCLLLWVWWNKKSLKDAPVALQIRRSGAGFLSMMTLFYSSTKLPLAIATVLQYTSPLFVMLELMLLHRRPQGSIWKDWVLLLIGFAGVVLILQPQWIPYPPLALAAGLLSGLSAAVAYLQIRQLGQINEPEWRTVLFFSFFVLLVSFGLTLLVGDFSLLFPLGWVDGWWMFSVGISGMFAQLFLTRAYTKGSTVLTANLQFSTVVFACLLGYLMWGEIINQWEWTGTLLVISAGTLATIRAKSN